MVNEKGTSNHGESHYAVFPLGPRDMAILTTTICNTAFIYFVDLRIWTNEAAVSEKAVVTPNDTAFYEMFHEVCNRVMFV